MILKLIGLVASIILVGATTVAWCDSVTSTKRREVAKEGKFIVFASFLVYALAAYLLGLTPLGWIAALAMAILALIATGYFAMREFPFLKVSLWVQLTLAIVAALAAGVSSVAGLKEFFGSYLIFALVIAAFTVATNYFLRPTVAEKANRARQEQAAQAQAAQTAAQPAPAQTTPAPAPAAPAQPAQAAPQPAPAPAPASTPEAPPAQTTASGGGGGSNDFERRLADAFEVTNTEASAQPASPAQPATPSPAAPASSNTPAGSSAPSSPKSNTAANVVGVIIAVALVGAIIWVPWPSWPRPLAGSPDIHYGGMKNEQNS